VVDKPTLPFPQSVHSYLSEKNITTTAQVDTSATAISGGRELFAVPLGKTGQIFNDYSNDRLSLQLQPETILTACGITASGTGAKVNFAANIVERI